MEISEMDALAQSVLKEKFDIEELKEKIAQREKKIEEVMDRIYAYFVESKREEPYKSPYGTLYLREVVSVLQPVGPKLREIFEHFKKLHGEDVAWTIMTINNNKLKSQIKLHNEAVEERGGDPILEPFPGVEPPKKTKVLIYKKDGKKHVEE